MRRRGNRTGPKPSASTTISSNSTRRRRADRRIHPTVGAVRAPSATDLDGSANAWRRCAARLIVSCHWLMICADPAQSFLYHPKTQKQGLRRSQADRPGHECRQHKAGGVRYHRLLAGLSGLIVAGRIEYKVTGISGHQKTIRDLASTIFSLLARP
jgi:hypothetical protein